MDSIRAVTGQISPPTARAGDTPQKVRDAASQFEGLLIAQMLRSARESNDAGALGEDHSSDSIMEMAESQISSILASSGGLGLSRLIVQGLGTSASPEPTVREVHDK